MSSAQPSTADLRQQVIGHRVKSSKKSSGPSASHIAAYAGAFLLFVAVVAVGYESPKNVSSQVASVSESDRVITQDSDSPSVDQVVATGVAADLAERANLPVASNIANMSVSLAAKSELAQTDTSAITKPQIIQPTSSNQEIITYKVKKGETVPAVASKFGISANTVRWANGLTDTDALEPGRKLTILPTSGLLYTVKSGDSLQSIASKFNSNAERITLVNNLEISGVKTGKRIIIPEGVKPAPASPSPQAPTSSGPAGQSFGSDLGGSVVSSNLMSASAGNRYAPGNCTWYVYERRQQLGKPIGSFWGNANTWASNARAAGFTVSNTPKAGSILTDQAGYFGHVGVVERVKPNGDIVITEMNNFAYGGFNIVNERTISAGQARAYQYID